MRRLIAVAGAVIVAATACFGATAIAPPTADANIRYWSGSQGGGLIKWTWQAGYGYVVTNWGSIYKNGGAWANWFSYSGGSSYYGAYSQANPVQTNNPNPLALTYVGCHNNNASTIISNCWMQQ